MKQINFRHFNTNSKKSFETVIFFPERSKNGSKKANIILFSIFKEFLAILRQFRIISEDFRRLPTIPEDERRGPTIAEDVRRTLQTLNSISFGNGKH